MHSEVLLGVYPDLRFAWHSRSLLATDRAGAVVGEGLQGLYEHDARLLSRWRLTVHQRVPRLVANSAVETYASEACHVAPLDPEGEAGVDALGLPLDERDREIVVHVRRFVGRGLHEHVEVMSFGMAEARIELAWEVDADFADLMEARAGTRQQTADVSASWHDARLRFEYGHPRLAIGTQLTFSHAGFDWDGSRVTCTLTLGPRDRRRLCAVVAPVIDGRVQEPMFGCADFDAPDPERLDWTRGATRMRWG